MTERERALGRRDTLLLLGAAAAAPGGVAMASGRVPAAGPVTDRGALLVPGRDGLVLPPGRWRVDADLTLNSGLVLSPGARIDIAAGRRLTVQGAFSAPVEHVFTGAGTVDLNRAALVAAHPEWFGAQPGNGAADSLPALRACLAAHPVMLLRADDYYLSDTWAIERPFVRIWGSGYLGRVQGEGTRLIVKSATADVVRVGPARQPGAVNDFLQAVDLRWMNLGRTERVSSGGGREPAGLRAQYVLLCQFEGLSSRENGVGFAAVGAVRSTFRDCIAFRSIPGLTAGTFRGFHLGGLDQVGLAGANGSVFLTDCNVSIGGSPGVADAVGLLLDGGFADSFITNFEATSLATGIRVNGRRAEMGGAAVAGHANLHIRMPIVDQCRAVGIEIADTSDYALIDISDCYVAVAPGAEAAIRCTDARGSTSIVGGQLIGRSDKGGQAAGLAIANSRGIDTTALKIMDFARPVVVHRSSAVRLNGHISNPAVKSEGAAVTLADCRTTAVDMRAGGMARAFSDGVSITGARSESLRVAAQFLDREAIRRSPVALDEPALRRKVIVEGG